MKKLEHVGIAVADLSASIPLFEKLLNTACYKTERVESEQVDTAFFRTGETKVELLQSLSPEGVIARYVEKRGEGIHHLAFEVDRLEDEVQRLLGAGFRFLNTTPKRGADNKLICFLHPSCTNGVLIELCQAISPEP